MISAYMPHAYYRIVNIRILDSKNNENTTMQRKVSFSLNFVPFDTQIGSILERNFFFFSFGVKQMIFYLKMSFSNKPQH